MIFPYVKNQQIFYCPSGHSAGGWPKAPGWDRNYLSYGMGKIANCHNMDPYEEPGYSLAEYQQPAQSILVAESTHTGDAAGANQWERIAFAAGPCGAACHPEYQKEDNTRHSGGSNIAFVDGHVKWMSAWQIRDAWNKTIWRGRFPGD